MSRTGALLSLSREHHASLVMARNARRAASENEHDIAAAVASIEAHWHRLMAAHVEQEEQLIGIAADTLDPESVARILADHAELRTLASASCPLEPAARLHRFADLTIAHVRYEERVFFPQLQNRIHALLPPPGWRPLQTYPTQRGNLMNFPDFYEQVPVVRTHDPFAAMLGASRDGVLEYRYLDAVRLAGHSCPTVAGAFLVGRAALAALYPNEPAERGAIAVHMPAPENEGTTGVVAQVLTLLTGAAAVNGFQGIQGRFRRKGLLSFADRRGGEAITFKRLDNGAGVAVSLDVSPVPGDPAQGERLRAILQDTADATQRTAFANAWQDRVRRLLLEFADDPRVIRVTSVQ